MREKGAIRKNLIRLIILATVALLLVFTQSTVARAGILTPEEEQMLALINQERVANNLRPLEIEEKLVEIARQHSQEMVQEGYFAHDSPNQGSLLDRVESAGIEGWVEGGENLADASDIESAFKALMASPSHRENILNPGFTHIGIGIVEGGQYGKVITQDLLRIEDKGTVVTAKVVDGSRSKQVRKLEDARVAGASTSSDKALRNEGKAGFTFSLTSLFILLKKLLGI